MDERAESQSVPEGGRHVGDGHISVALTLQFTPQLQSFDGSHAPQQPSNRRGASARRRSPSKAEMDKGGSLRERARPGSSP